MRWGWVAAVVVWLAGMALAAPPAFEWPDRFQYDALLEVSDAATLDQGLRGVGVVFADYTISTMRVDETWNAAQLASLPYGRILGDTVADQHMIYASSQEFSFVNTSGAQCSSLPIGIESQTMFGPDTFVGKTAVDGVPALMWTAHSTIFGIAVNTTLLADAQSMVPLAVFMAGAPNSLIGANSRRIFNFQAREEPFPAATFTSVCGL